MTDTVCIYHANCADGIGAAMAVRTAYPAADFLAASYGDTPPDVKDKSVIIVDFSYPRDVLIAMAEDAATILVIDHHETARRNLVDLPENVEAVFDMTSSGAALTWRYFGLEAPSLISYVEDRDLWRWGLLKTKEIMAAVFSNPMTFEVWERLLQQDVNELAAEGEALLRGHMASINKAIQEDAFEAEICGHKVPVLNAPHQWASDAGNILARGRPFAAIIQLTGTKCRFSLRSDSDGVDVAVIAEKFGGGGHKHAAGFDLPLTNERWILEAS